MQKLIMFVFALAALYGGYYWGNQYAPGKPTPNLIKLLPSPRPLKSPDLIDQFAEPFTAQQLKGHWSLVLFGYSHSPPESPEMLRLSTSVLNRLADKPVLRQMTRVIFVTVDPQRDQPDILKSFVGPYGPDFLGVGGSVAQINDFAGQLGANFRRQTGKDDADYRVEHSTSIALIDPQARLVGLFTGLVDAVNIASDMKLIAADYENHESP